MRRIAVIDSTPLISLVHVGLAGQLSLYFDTIYVPRAVQIEVNRKQRFRYRLARLYQGGTFLRCASADPIGVQLLEAELDKGESEGLIQAQEKQAHYFIGDEKRAREICTGFGLIPVGTLRLLARLHLEGQAVEIQSLVRKLSRDLRFRVSQQVIDEAIRLASVPI